MQKKYDCSKMWLFQMMLDFELIFVIDKMPHQSQQVIFTNNLSKQKIKLDYISFLMFLINIQFNYIIKSMKKSQRIRKLSESTIISNRQVARKRLQDSLKTKYSFMDEQTKLMTDQDQQNFDLKAEKPKLRSKTIDFGTPRQTPAIPSGFCFFQIFSDYYDLGQKIGQGGQSVVYECTKKSNAKKYAVKVTRSDSQEVFNIIKKTYMMLKKIDHDNIIKVFDLYVDEDEGVSHMVMQKCSSSDLRNFMKINKQATESLKINILKQISRAIEFLHRNQICHRDIKPDNIMFDPQHQTVKIVDFQIAKISQPDSKVIEMWTDTGSLYYRAPQSFDGLYTQQIDVWAIGVIAFQLFTGKLPFKSNYRKQTIRKIQNIEIDFDKLDVPPQILQLIKKTLEKQPSKRIKSSELLALKCFNM